MDKADLIGGAGITVFGLLLIFVIIPLGTEEGMFFGLSPTFFPVLLASCMTACAAGLTLQAARRLLSRRESPPLPINRWNFMMFLAASALAIAGVVVIDWFGILIGGPLLIAAFMLFLGERHPIRIAATATLPVIGVYLLAIHVLGTPVP